MFSMIIVLLALADVLVLRLKQGEGLEERIRHRTTMI